MGTVPIFDLNNYFFNVYAVPDFLIAAILFFLGVFVWLKNYRAKLNASFGLLAVFIGGWFFFYAIVFSFRLPEIALFWNKIVYIFVPFLASNMLLFMAVLLEREKQYKKFIVASYLTMFVFTILAFFHPEFLKEAKLFWWGYYGIYGRLGYAFLAVFIFFSLLMYIILLPAYRSLKVPLKKKQALSLIVALAFAYTALADFLPKFGYSWYPLGSVSFFIFILIIVYSIFRYKAFSLTPQVALENIITTISDALILLNKEKKIEYANPAALAMFGYSQSEMLGKNMEELVARSKACSEESWSEMIKKGKFIDPDAEIKTKEGKKVPAKISLSAIYDPAGEILGVICVSHDVSEIQNLISELTQKTQELEKSKSALETKEKELRDKVTTLEHFKKVVKGEY